MEGLVQKGGGYNYELWPVRIDGAMAGSTLTQTPLKSLCWNDPRHVSCRVVS